MLAVPVFTFRSFLCNFHADLDLEDSVMANLQVLMAQQCSYKQPYGLCPKEVFLKTKPFEKQKTTNVMSGGIPLSVQLAH